MEIRRIICGFILAGACGVILSDAAAAYRRQRPDPLADGSPRPGISIGKEGDFKAYYPLADGCPLTIQGPGLMRFFVRAHVPAGGAPPESVTVILDGLSGFAAQRWFESVKPSRTSRYGDDRAGGLTGGRRIELAIPSGLQQITVTGTSNTGVPVFGLFYYDGPPVPKARPETAPAPPVRKTPWLRTNRNVLAGVIYDDNICRYSDDTLELFASGERPDKFAITNREDMIVNTRMQVEFYRNLLFGKKTALRFRYQRWDYIENEIKNNDEYNLRFRQTFRRYDYLEATYTYAPNSYIKELSDRPPFISRTVRREYMHFRITRNAFNLGYRFRQSRRFSWKLFGGRTLRFYNRPFLENDLWEWNFRLETDIRTKRITTSLRYAYADVAARGYDEVGETLETSDNDGDGSYEKDTYRIRLTYRPRTKAYRPGSSAAGLMGAIKTLGSWIDRGLVKCKTSSFYAQYKLDRQFYTSQRPLAVDPLHVGRLDVANQVQVQWMSKPVWNRISIATAWRYTVRTADSPGGLVGDDPSEEKDYTGTRFWVQFSRPF